MADDDYKRIFSKNLKYYMEVNHKNQMDLINDLKLSSSTVSNWCTGLKLPRMDKVQMLADYFGILKSDLIEEKVKEDIELTSRDRKNIDKMLDQMREQLTSQEGLMFDGGEPASPEAIESILDAMKIGMELAKKKNKEKYTPKKYRKD